MTNDTATSRGVPPMTDTAREPQERMPVITAKHVEEIDCTIAFFQNANEWCDKGQLITVRTRQGSFDLLRDIAALVRSISSGEAGIYDTRTEVKVSLAQIKRLHELCLTGKAEDVRDELYGATSGWLASPAYT